jgi:dihydroxy-acid dehydratase
VPFIADLKPSGKYVMEDVQKIGGTPAVMKYLLEKGLIDGSCMVRSETQLRHRLWVCAYGHRFNWFGSSDFAARPCFPYQFAASAPHALRISLRMNQQTVTGKTIAENLKDVPSLSPGQEIIMPLEKPIKPTGHLQILYGNIAPVTDTHQSRDVNGDS